MNDAEISQMTGAIALLESGGLISEPQAHKMRRRLTDSIKAALGLPSAFSPGRVVRPMVERPGERIEPDRFDAVRGVTPKVEPPKPKRPPEPKPTRDEIIAITKARLAAQDPAVLARLKFIDHPHNPGRSYADYAQFIFLHAARLSVLLPVAVIVNREAALAKRQNFATTAPWE